MKQTFFETEIVKIIDETVTTRRYFFRVVSKDSFEYSSGQFVMLQLDINSKIPYRSYSIASTPDGSNLFELIIVLNPPGAGTPFIWDNYKVGSKVMCAGPLGKFVLPKQIQSDLCFICTGTGIAPLRSMLWHIINNKIPHHRIYFVFGARTKADLLYFDEMVELTEQHKSVSFIPVLSRETPETWNGKIGYVHQVYEEIFSNKRPAEFFICGWSAMLKEARERLALMGYQKEHIHFERYD
jgi:CDP-4-dehydro-6-deoxyglucose reductase